MYSLYCITGGYKDGACSIKYNVNIEPCLQGLYDLKK